MKDKKRKENVMKTRKTKKRNIIRRTVAFLLCMTMVLGLGMQDVIEQVYAEEAIPVIEQEAATEEAGELTTEGAAPEENAETAEEPDESVEEAEEQEHSPHDLVTFEEVFEKFHKPES